MPLALPSAAIGRRLPGQPFLLVQRRPHTVGIMAVVVVCALLVLLGLVAVLRWGGLAFQAPSGGDPAGHPPVGLVVRSYIWYVTVALVSGLGAGILAAGAGGRLVMRLLAVTSGPNAQGRITEAEQVVGRITADGTLGFVVFNGIPIGLLSAVLYLLLRRWLPAGRLGGFTLGALLLLVAGTRIDPLRANNADFSIVGPAWLAVAAFVALGLLHGMVVAALAGRYSRALPLLTRQARVLAAYSPLLLFVLLFPLLAAIPVIVLMGMVAVLVSQIPPLLAAWRDRRVAAAGRVALVAAGLVALPGFTSALADILGL